jgi:uncharacterized membrane protein YgdD (TMEM256/DUF423 family)
MLAASNGFLAVSLGAFAAHALSQRLGPELLGTFQTAVQYHMIHALALLGVGVLTLNYPNARYLEISGYLFMLGIVLFSGSLYGLSLTGMRWLGPITPLGGICFLAAWGCLFWSAMSNEFSH